ncbi:MAG: hypothetical protein KC587_13630 [Nitrospira sp.]|nr:hypothetical protein [Nitrospira sp.]MCA9457700.1 hypothetical protein [Nitrospira sp.]MCW5784321.1 hypothetical protein [Nitrospirales bacterium]
MRVLLERFAEILPIEKGCPEKAHFVDCSYPSSIDGKEGSGWSYLHEYVQSVMDDSSRHVSSPSRHCTLPFF